MRQLLVFIAYFHHATYNASHHGRVVAFRRDDPTPTKIVAVQSCRVLRYSRLDFVHKKTFTLPKRQHNDFRHVSYIITLVNLSLSFLVLLFRQCVAGRRGVAFAAEVVWPKGHFR